MPFLYFLSFFQFCKCRVRMSTAVLTSQATAQDSLKDFPAIVTSLAHFMTIAVWIMIPVLLVSSPFLYFK